MSEYITAKDIERNFSLPEHIAQGFIELGKFERNPDDQEQFKLESVKKYMKTWNGHTEPCMVNYVKVELERMAWFKRWPNSCKMCSGSGGKSCSGDYYEPPYFNDCLGTPERRCFGDGLCPRCGEMLSEEDAPIPDKCKSCGWELESGTEDNEAPYGYDECNCYEFMEIEWNEAQEQNNK